MHNEETMASGRPRESEQTRQAPEPVVELAPITKADVIPLHHWFLAGEPETVTCRPLILRSDFEEMAYFRAHPPTPDQGGFALRRCADNALVGRLRWFDFNPRSGAVEIGYLIGPQYRNQGYAAQGLSLLADWLFAQGARKLVAQTGSFNTASIALLRRAGFQLDGILRNHHIVAGQAFDDHVYSLLREESLGGSNDGAR